MGLLSDLAITPSVYRCGCCDLLDRLDADDREILLGLLADSSMRYDEIAAKLTEKGVSTLDRSVYSRCARGLCAARRKLRESAKAHQR